MLSIQLINLYNNTFVSANLFPISFIRLFTHARTTFVLFTLLTLTDFNKYKNLVLGTLSLVISSNVITENIFII